MNTQTFIVVKHYALVAMRITFIQLVIAIACCGLVLAGSADAQNLDSLYVEVELRGQSLESLFSQIEGQTGLRFAYQIPEVERYETTTLPFARRSVKETLDAAFENTTLSYRQAGKSIIIYIPEKTAGNSNDNIRVTVSGTVRSKDNTPVPGVNILIKGTNLGTTTDNEGRYQLEVNEGSVLVFSFIGYKPQEITVTNQTVLDITLEEDATTLQTVEIFGGYYTESQRTSTGNIARATAKDLSGQPVVNPLQALQGRLAGVQIVQVSGIPGSVMSIQVRGQNSVRTEKGVNNPLYIIDGVPVSSVSSTSYAYNYGFDPLNTINPENIESIDVLKDAAATAIYGSRGANGVVLITTKKAPKNQEGRTGVDVSFYQGFSKANLLEGMMTAKQYLAMRREAFKNDGITPTDNPVDNGTNGLMFAPDLTVWDTTRSTNWQQKLLGGTAAATDAQLSVYGGNAQTSFRFNTGYHRETTIFGHDFEYRRFSGGLNVDHRSKDNKLHTNISITYGTDNRKFFNGDLTDEAVRLAPVAPRIYNEDGTLNWAIHEGRSTWQNPVADLLTDNTVKAHNLITNVTVKYEIVSGLSVKSNMGYTRAASDEVLTLPLAMKDPTLQFVSENSTQVTNNSNGSWIVEPQLVYTREVAKGQLDALIGSTWQGSESALLSLIGYRYPSDELLGDLASAARVTRIASTGLQYRYTAVFGRIAYNWKEKYLISLTARRDGSSRFGPDKKFATFGAVGVGWVFTEEKFMKALSGVEGSQTLSFGKLRASYGTAGSDFIGDYGYLDTYTATTGTYGGSTGLYPFSLSSDDYAWEVVRKLEVGLELGFFQDRLALITSWYLNRSSNQLIGDQLPIMTGFSTVTANLPATVQNTGLEIVLNSTNVQSPAFRWSTSLNLTIPRNKLISYPNLEGTYWDNVFTVGESLNSAKLFRSKGVNPQTGLYEVEDVNGDGVLDLDDQVVTIDLGRRWYGGIENRFSYRGIEVGFLFEFVRQQAGNEVKILDYTAGYGMNNQFSSTLDRWQNIGDVAQYQRFTQTPVGDKPYFNIRMSDRSFDDASFIRLKTASIGYNLPSTWTQRIKMKQCRIYMQAQNLVTFTKYRGFDPQIPGRQAVPPLKTISAGINISF